MSKYKIKIKLQCTLNKVLSIINIMYLPWIVIIIILPIKNFIKKIISIK